MNESKCPICKNITISVEHHITSRCYGGTNKPSNKTNICPTCHSLIHYGELIIEGKFFCPPYGITLIFRKKDEPSITGKPDPKVWLYSNKEK